MSLLNGSSLLGLLALVGGGYGLGTLVFSSGGGISSEVIQDKSQKTQVQAPPVLQPKSSLEAPSSSGPQWIIGESDNRQDKIIIQLKSTNLPEPSQPISFGTGFSVFVDGWKLNNNDFLCRPDHGGNFFLMQKINGGVHYRTTSGEQMSYGSCRKPKNVNSIKWYKVETNSKSRMGTEVSKIAAGSCKIIWKSNMGADLNGDLTIQCSDILQTRNTYQPRQWFEITAKRSTTVNS